MAIDIPQLNSFCGCSLKTATISAGVMQLVILLLLIVNVTINTIRYLLRRDKIRYDEIAADILFYHSVFIQALFSLILIFGALKDKSSFLMAWLLFGISYLIENLWNIIWSTIRYFHWEFFIEDLIVIGFNLTAMLVVYNHYRKMSKDKYGI